MKVIFVYAVLALAAANVSPPHGVAKDVASHVVNLDDPGFQRWQTTVKPYSALIKPVIDYVKGLLPPEAFAIADDVLAALDNKLGEPWSSEIRGVAAATGLDLGEIVMMNLFYEFNSGCTSIVAQLANGEILHGRNLDYSLPDLQNITIQVNFTRGDKLVYQTTTYAGYIGALTGMRPGALSLSLDQRHANGTLWDNLKQAIFHDGQSVGFTLRGVLDSNKTFEDAIAHLSTVDFMSVEYIIIGGAGPEEGAVITRAREDAIDVWRIQYPSRWFLVETNYDHWKPVPSTDDRRDPANKFINQFSPANFSIPELTTLMGRYPTLNGDTTYTTVMSAAKGYYHVQTQNN